MRVARALGSGGFTLSCSVYTSATPHTFVIRLESQLGTPGAAQTSGRERETFHAPERPATGERSRRPPVLEVITGKPARHES